MPKTLLHGRSIGNSLEAQASVPLRYVRCKERSFYPFVFAVHVFQYAFSQCDGSAAGCIQFMDMMSLAHGDVITGGIDSLFLPDTC